MVSLGISLLPFYFLAAIKLFLIESPTTHFTPKTVALYFAATILSVFMDGYTFMMFAVGASILLLCSLIMRPEIRTTLIKTAFPTHIASFLFAYVLFSTYIGQSSFSPQPIDARSEEHTSELQSLMRIS